MDSLQWEDLGDSRGRLGAAVVESIAPSGTVLCAWRSFGIKIIVVGGAPCYNHHPVGPSSIFYFVEPVVFRNNALQNGTDLFGGIQLSYIYSVVCLVVLCSLLINDAWFKLASICLVQATLSDYFGLL